VSPQDNVDVYETPASAGIVANGERPRKDRRGCKGCLVFCLIVGVLVFGVLYLLHWWDGPLRYLQFHASNVHDYYDDAGGGWTGDFSRRIEAQCSEETFHAYAAQQGLTRRLDAAGAAKVQIGWGGAPYSWWTPPQNLEGAYYFYRDGGKRRLLAYHEGHLYYDIEVW
jgi:hypothetical protein